MACAGDCLFFIFSPRRFAQRGSVRSRSAHEIAYEQLEMLRLKDLARAGKDQRVLFELSGILRHYLEGRFALRAPEMTTEEFLAHVRDTAALPVEYAGS